MLSKKDTPDSLGMKPDEAVEANLLLLNIAPSLHTPRDPRFRRSDEEGDRVTGAAAASATASMPDTPASEMSQQPKLVQTCLWRFGTVRVSTWKCDG